MELYQLRGFAAVAEFEHLTRAADKLHVSQPALSAQIKALEDELGIPLFERGTAGMTLTPAGKRLLPEAHAVIAAARTLRNTAQGLKGAASGHARVGTLADPEFVRLPRFLASAVARYPLLEIMLRHEVSGAAFDKVKSGDLDASFYYGSRAHPTVASIALRTFAYRIVAPAAWQDRILGANFHDIAGLPWIMTPPNSSHRALARDLFDHHGMAPTIAVEADHEAVISSLVVGGLGVGLMREDLAQAMAAAGEICIWEGTRLATTLQFLHLRERTGEPMIQALLDIVHDVWPQAAVSLAA
jgi:DNA-binding transcriptional LysR family regulator